MMRLLMTVKSPSDTMLDPSCGDDRFLALHGHAVGVEHHSGASEEATARAPHATIFESDFFSWATTTSERFDCAAGKSTVHPVSTVCWFGAATGTVALCITRRSFQRANAS
jgi:hypothetical protein